MQFNLNTVSIVLIIEVILIDRDGSFAQKYIIVYFN